MNLKELIKELEVIAEDPKNLDKDITITGCYASEGDIEKIYVEGNEIFFQSDICSG